MIIAHITDIHVRAWGQQSHGYLPAHLVLLKTIEHLNAMRPRPDLVVITGDLTHSGREAEYETLRTLLNRLEVPLAVIPGNHDSREMFLRTMAHLPLDTTGSFVQFIHDTDQMRIIGVDSLKKGSSAGEICAQRLAWLDQALSGATGKPVIVALHHPPILVGMTSMDPIWLKEGREELAALLTRHGSVKALLCGHHHRPIMGMFAGVPVFCGQSLVAQGDFGLDPNDPNTFSEEPTSFYVHWWTPENGLVTHTDYVDEFPGKYPW